VQCVKWHPKEEGVLISAGFDKKVVLYNVLVDSKASQTAKIDNEVESLCWEPHEGMQFAVSDEKGVVKILDARFIGGESVIQFQAHSKQTTSLAYSFKNPGILVTSSNDGSLKTWDVSKGEAKMLFEKKCEIGEIFTTAISKDVENTLAAGGSKGELLIWEIEP